MKKRTLIAGLIAIGIIGSFAIARHQPATTSAVDVPAASPKSKAAPSAPRQTSSEVKSNEPPQSPKVSVEDSRAHGRVKPQMNLPRPRAVKPLAKPSEKVYRALYLPKDQPTSQWYPAKIKAPEAWDKTTGSPEVTVAVIDSGFSLEHDELVDRWAVNLGESGNGKETNNTDDDGNGFIDDWRGWDFYHGDSNPMAGQDSTNGQAVSHGTSVAGLVGAAGNNGIGVASVNWQVRILPIQVLSDHGYGVSTDVADAIRYAVDQGADIISMSLGTDDPDPYIEDQIDYAMQHSVLLVAAAGNDGCNCIVYPANYNNVLAVGATDSTDTIADFSSFGANLDVVAPGAGTMHSPKYNGADRDDYATTLYGTSFATPIVSGQAAMLKGLNANLTPLQITNLIKNSADTVPGMSSQAYKYGAGRINVFASVMAAQPGLANTSLPEVGAPVFRLYKNGQADEYTSLPERRDELLAAGYQYQIIRNFKQ